MFVVPSSHRLPCFFPHVKLNTCTLEFEGVTSKKGVRHPTPNFSEAVMRQPSCWNTTACKIIQQMTKKFMSLTGQNLS